MWATVFGIAVGIAVPFWLAVILLTLRDRFRGDPPLMVDAPGDESETVEDETETAEAAPTPLWKRAMAIPLALLVGPPLILIVLVILAPLFAVQLGAFAFYWLRFQIHGIPNPWVGEIGEDASVPDPR